MDSIIKKHWTGLTGYFSRLTGRKPGNSIAFGEAGPFRYFDETDGWIDVKELVRSISMQCSTISAIRRTYAPLAHWVSSFSSGK
jgi:hypothetical protein